MARVNSKKLILWLSMSLSLFAVIVTAISTYAWFQVFQKDPEATMIAGSSDMSVESITGYKINPSLGVNGFRDYGSTTVEALSGSNLAVDNSSKGTVDIDYDIPVDGAGYYLVKQNPNNGYTYKYGNDYSYSERFHKYENADNSTKTVYIDHLEFDAGQKVRIKNYKFDGSSNAVAEIDHIYGASATVTPADGKNIDITVTDPGTYRVWFDYTTDDTCLGFEPYTSNGFSDRNNGTPEESTIKRMYFQKPDNWGNVENPQIYLVDGEDPGHWGDPNDDATYANMTWVQDWVNNNKIFYYDVDTSLYTTMRFEINQTTTNRKYSSVITISDSYNYFRFNDWVDGNYREFSVYSSNLKTYFWDDSGDGSTSLTNLKAHFFDGSENTTWPGLSMTSLGSNNLYWILVPSDNEGIIFNGNRPEGARQTVDISLTGGDYHERIWHPSGWYDGKITGSWKVQIDITPSYFIVNKANDEVRLRFDDPISYSASQGAFSGYTPSSQVSSISDSITIEDDTNGIYYYFTIHKENDEVVYYSNRACTAKITGTTTQKEIFVKLETDYDYYSTVYIDLRNSYNAGNESYRWTEAYAIDWNNSSSYQRFVKGVKVSHYLHRLTLPKTFHLRIGGNGTSNDADRSKELFGQDDWADAKYKLSNYITEQTILFIYPSANSSAFHDYKFCGLLDSDTHSTQSYGTAKVQKYEDSEWKDIANGTMVPGDRATTYDFILENGLEIAAGTEVRIYVSGGTNSNYNDDGYGYSAYSTPPYYVTNGGLDGGIITRGYSGNARFNFYLTISQHVEMKVVPEEGNGFYIMDYGRSSWNDASMAYKMIYDDPEHPVSGSIPANASSQYYADITFAAGNVWKVRSDGWINVEYEFDSNDAAKFSVSNDGNRNITVVTGGTYRLYFKVLIAGGYSLYITSSGAGTPVACDPDSSFESGSYYVVGGPQFHTGVQVTTGGSDGYFGETKMGSNGEISATYKGYYVQAGQDIYIRSYFNSTDTLMTSYNTPLPTGVTIGSVASGVIHFANDGFYNIYIYNGTITVEEFTTSDKNDFFRLNELDTTASKIDETSDIWAQKTALILEIAFKCNNPYESKMSITMANSVNYVGAFLYCSLDKLPDPYDTLHGKSSQAALYNGTNMRPYTAHERLVDLNDITIPANSSAVHYAYICIDYLPTSFGTVSYPGTFIGSSLDPRLLFYLNATQV